MADDTSGAEQGSSADAKQIIDLADRIMKQTGEGFQRSLEAEMERGTTRVDYVEALIKVCAFNIAFIMNDWCLQDDLVEMVKRSMNSNFDQTIEAKKKLHMSEEQ